MGRVLNAAVHEIVLNESKVCALVVESEDPGIALHVGMRGHWQLKLLPFSYEE